MSNYGILLVVTMDLFLGCLIEPIECVNGCITVQNRNGKQTICRTRHNFTRVPPKLPKELVSLEIKHQKIRSLTSDQLMGIPMLLQLIMDSNQISSIAEDTFRYVPKLRNLSLCNNMLILGGNAFPSSALFHLKELVSLDLKKNPLNFVPDFFFRPLRTLKRLYLSRAPPGFKIRPNGLAGLTNLEVLDLSYCNLTNLQPNGLKKALLSMQLHTLYLYGNPWRCDCRIKWLHKWLNPSSPTVAAAASTVKLYRVYKKGNGQLGVLQPQCSYPRQLYKRNIFQISLSTSSFSRPYSPYSQQQSGSPSLPRYDHLTSNDLVCPPRIMWKSPVTRVDRGHNLTLKCGFEAEPSAQVQWSKNGMIVGKHWSRISWTQSSPDSPFSRQKSSSHIPADKYRFVASLFISPTKLEDTGTWRCLLATVIGKANSSFQVRVKHTAPPPLDLSIILKYIGIGAVTLILFLVVIGIAIYCVYGFKFRSFSPHPTHTATKPPSHNNGVANSSNIRPQLLVDKSLHESITQKCMLLPNSPTMILPSNSAGDTMLQQPCPLHGPVISSPPPPNPATAAVLPHTLPRHKHHHQCHGNHGSQHQAGSPTPLPCPLHGHLISTPHNPTQPHNPPPSQDNNEDPNLNSIYSFFFSPRHSQPIINTNHPHQFIPNNNHPHQPHHHQDMTSSMIQSTINHHTTNDPARPCSSAGRVHIVSSARSNHGNDPIVKLHDEEEYVF